MIMILLMVAIIVAIIIFFKYSDSKLLNGIFLPEKIEGTGIEPVEASLALGDEGKAISRLNPIGRAEFNGKEVEVTCRDGFTEAGASLKIVRLEQGRVTVRIINNQ